MERDAYPAVQAAFARMPEWIRTELASKEPAARQRAEEALAAIVVNALGHDASERPA
ncbi:hypothetical protein [Hephaestia mangrovi]|uniref:hypothetical protein n=1 Tax=Hephaestia mangrovi TaxID=2873268 RepID=UPI001CA6F764|nr:hypothetical protein [Hephaestia mangrovi]MBY8826584.1 hypothetical protein [Hephaestia mangrovi]